MLENVIKKLFPILDEKGQPCTFPTFASQVFFNDGSVLEGKDFGGGAATVDPLTIYPVGSIYMSANETSPAELFGGTWEQLKDRFLLGAGGSYVMGSAGGEANHELSIAEIPNHKHTLAGAPNDGTDYTWAAPHLRVKYVYTEDNPYPSNVITSDIGSGAAHNNMPPYLAVNMWKRVS